MSFRAKLLLAIMLVVSGITAAVLYFAQRNVDAVVTRDLHRDFEAQLAALHANEEARNADLAQRCRALVAKPRIHAALEDNALDLLYPSAQDELRDLITSGATFYRFLGPGGVLRPPDNAQVGGLTQAEEAQLAIDHLPDQQQIGYLFREETGATETVEQVIAMPISSTETGAVIAALLVGFPAGENNIAHALHSGIWTRRQLHLPALPRAAQIAIADELTRVVGVTADENSLTIDVEGTPHLLFYKRLNPGSLFPAAYEICVYSFADAIAQRQRLRRRILGAGVALLLVALIASQFASARLSRPVEKLAIESETNRVQRREAEFALAARSAELQRAARFSADASHQLKTPVTVLRAGIESLLGRDGFERETYDELSSLLHQTYRLTGVIDDLLLLSRMDAGRLQLELTPINLTQIIEEWIDDFSAIPDPFHLSVEPFVPRNLRVLGERRYTMLIVQNLLENARKYNRQSGRIRISADEEEDQVVLKIGNTGPGISAESQEHIFERFHRGAIGENVPGHGLGLNLARELTRLHGGDLHLAESGDDWTEFEVCFQKTMVSSPDGTATT
ncbi:MAG: sensor histidine kinase [Chthoniobacterales bacterium]